MLEAPVKNLTAQTSTTPMRPIPASKPTARGSHHEASFWQSLCIHCLGGDKQPPIITSANHGQKLITGSVWALNSLWAGAQFSSSHSHSHETTIPTFTTTKISVLRTRGVMLYDGSFVRLGGGGEWDIRSFSMLGVIHFLSYLVSAWGRVRCQVLWSLLLGSEQVPSAPVVGCHTTQSQCEVKIWDFKGTHCGTTQRHILCFYYERVFIDLY